MQDFTGECRGCTELQAVSVTVQAKSLALWFCIIVLNTASKQ